MCVRACVFQPHFCAFNACVVVRVHVHEYGSVVVYVCVFVYLLVCIYISTILCVFSACMWFCVCACVSGWCEGLYVCLCLHLNPHFCAC